MASRDRASRLNKVFFEVSSGQRRIRSVADAKLFLEAVIVRDAPATCAELLVSSKAGLEAIRSALRVDLSPEFLVKQVLRFVAYLSDEDVKTMANGRILAQIIKAVVEPPTVWRELLSLLRNQQVDVHSLKTMAWLTLECLEIDSEWVVDIVKDAEIVLTGGCLLEAEQHQIRELGYRIQNSIQLKAAAGRVDDIDSCAGGRHDNDFADFRKITILPTTDEILSTLKPFYRTAHEVFTAKFGSVDRTHLDNQFRLLREDMLAELRQDLALANSKRKGKSALTVFGGLTVLDVNCGNNARAERCRMHVTCSSGLEWLVKIQVGHRKAYLENNKNILRHQSLGALCAEASVVAFAYLERDIERLAEQNPIMSLVFTDTRAWSRALTVLKSGSGPVSYVLVDTPIFAYEPILKGLQDLRELPLSEAIIQPTAESLAYDACAAVRRFAIELGALPVDSDDAVRCEKFDITLERSQRDAIVNALQSTVSVIQGPPGTGKSFVGSQFVRYIHSLTDQKILVISFTNHALDQFLEELLDVAIPNDDIVRLGSKSTIRTSGMLLAKQRSMGTRPQSFWNSINALEVERQGLVVRLEEAMMHYHRTTPSFGEIMEYLEFSETWSQFHMAFCVPTEQSGFKTVGQDGKEIREDYLFDRWQRGLCAGNFDNQSCGHEAIWQTLPRDRELMLQRWRDAIMREHIEEIATCIGELDRSYRAKQTLLDQGKIELLQKKKIIACTTTAAAMYSSIIRKVQPEVVVVEEAGEILESHILTALTPATKQLVLIGDHKQLPPKINNYALSIAKGDGYDLDRSLFERLILHGVPHSTLRKQHRMHPDISEFPRQLTYANLLDGPKTHKRREITGVQARVVFIHHEEPEAQSSRLSDRRDPTTKASKTNLFEAEMTMKCIKYLMQQGYDARSLVVLTPYLGQLRMLHDTLSRDNDPVLNDMDKYDLLRMGATIQSTQSIQRSPLRISTIDNFQGEESDIVVASLTRSNTKGDIGFMESPERLNVLLSRARCGIILLGNMKTFSHSRKGSETWRPFFEMLKARNSFYNGLPVKCERHPDRTMVLEKPEDFELHSPDGGCARPCETILDCGIHDCQLRCHRMTDHSKMKCLAAIQVRCPRGHVRRTVCSDQGGGCTECVREDQQIERRLKRDLALEAARLQRQKIYAAKLQRIEDELDHHRHTIKDIEDAQAEEEKLKERRTEAEKLRRTAQRMTTAQEEKEQVRVVTAADIEQDTISASNSMSDATNEWMQLRAEGAENSTLDKVMQMIGLEKVKETFMEVHARVDLVVRQRTSLKDERFSCTLLGNPGTGKTSIARLYAEFLGSVGVLPGSSFKETIGSTLSNGGVTACQGLLDELLDEGGGVLFIDEAYQMTSGSSAGGKAVLDYLLPQVENLTGKVVFILAGYNKEMEAFFAHNPGLPSRFPVTMTFADYTTQELLQIFQRKLREKYKGCMRCEDGLDGLYCRIVANRIGRGRGQPGFGNARTVENVLARVANRQAVRLRRAKRAKKACDDFLFTKEDLIGPKPEDALGKSKAWKDLAELIGLDSVKRSVRALVDTLQQNYVRELAEQAIVEYSLNKVFLGNPGTGKTTVAKIYGTILTELGLLSRGEVIVKTPSDFVGAHLGESERLTKGILSATLGKVLVIDEAYGLYDKSLVQDPYRSSVIDTIVAEVQGNPGADRCVLLLGYKDQMETMMQNVNPGLSRRFPLASAFDFQDFEDGELSQILELKLKKQDYRATDQGKNVVKEMLSRARNRPHFGNAGEVDIVLDAAKARHQARFSEGKTRQANMLEAVDFDPDFDRLEHSATNVDKLFANTVGTGEIIAQLKSYQETARSMKRLKLEPKESIPFNFLFRGPPGTGKTTTAKKMGKVFYDMGFLANAEVIECSASDIIGQYIGHTAPKVQQMMERALGKVLFIDEAYRLGEGTFAKEAVDEIVDCITKPRFERKLIVILAGYTQDINRLMSMNPGLTSRFPEVVDFPPMSPTDLINLTLQYFEAQKVRIEMNSADIVIDLSHLNGADQELMEDLVETFQKLSLTEGWANARDALTLAKTIFSKMINSITEDHTEGKQRLVLQPRLIRAELEALLEERSKRALAVAPAGLHEHATPLHLDDHTQERPIARSATSETVHRPRLHSSQSRDANQPLEPPQDRTVNCDITRPHATAIERDRGVSDAIWDQLQRDKEAALKRDAEHRALEKQREEAIGEVRAAILVRLLEEERLRREEARAQELLAQMGCCPMGYAWIKQDSGYRCAGGSHFVDNKEFSERR